IPIAAPRASKVASGPGAGQRQRPPMLRTRIRVGPVAGLVLSLLLAAALTAVQSFDRFVPAWAPGFEEPVRTTPRVPYGPRLQRDQRTGRVEFLFRHERVVIPPGTQLRREVEENWVAYVHESLRRPPTGARLVGMLVIFFTLAMALTSYLRKFAQSRLRLLRPQVGVAAAMLGLLLVAKGLLLFTALPAFWIPAATVPLWV